MHKSVNIGPRGHLTVSASIADKTNKNLKRNEKGQLNEDHSRGKSPLLISISSSLFISMEDRIITGVVAAGIGTQSNRRAVEEPRVKATHEIVF